MMRGMMQSSTQVMSAYNDVPDADKAAVRPHMKPAFGFASWRAWTEPPRSRSNFSLR